MWGTGRWLTGKGFTKSVEERQGLFWSGRALTGGVGGWQLVECGFLRAGKGLTGGVGGWKRGDCECWGLAKG